MSDEQNKNELALQRLRTSLAKLGNKSTHRRHQPIHQQRTMKVQGPSQLAGLDGSRMPGAEVRVSLGQSKAPKRRFNPGDRFKCEGSEWELLYMYRLRSEPSVWFHCLAERRPNESVRPIDVLVGVLGGGATTPRIVFTPFAHDGDASQYFWDLPRGGDSMIRTTQQLLKMERVTKQVQLPESKS